MSELKVLSIKVHPNEKLKWMEAAMRAGKPLTSWVKLAVRGFLEGEPEKLDAPGPVEIFERAGPLPAEVVPSSFPPGNDPRVCPSCNRTVRIGGTAKTGCEGCKERLAAYCKEN